MLDRELIIELRAAGYTPAAWRRYVSRHFAQARQVIEARPGATRSVLATGFVLFTLNFVFAAIVTVVLDAELGRRIFVWGAIALSIHGGWLLLHLGLLADREGKPLLRLGWPNAVTMLRTTTIAPMVLLLADGRVLWGFAVYLIGAASDVIDGAVARRTRGISRIGTVTDPLVDIAWNSGAVYGLVTASMLPAWVLWLVVLRYGTLVIGSAVLYLIRTTVRIRPTLFGKVSGLAIVTVIILAYLNRILMPPEVAQPMSGLIVTALTFLFSATILYVCILGVLNYRPQARAPGIGQVVGHVADGRASGTRHGA